MRFIQPSRILTGITVAVMFVCVILLHAKSGLAIIPPTPEQVEQYKLDGTYQERVERAKASGNYIMAPELAQRFQRKLRIMMADEAGELLPEMAPPPRWNRLPTTGAVNVLAVGIAFADYPNSNPQAYVQSALFGGGPGDTVYPFESLHNYYDRSSYSKLNLTGNMIGWYTTPYNRASVVQSSTGRDNVIKEALESFNASVDYSQYDGNNDGVVDYLIVLWTGPDNGWMNFWWAMRTSFSDSAYALDGVGFKDHTWLWEEHGGNFDVQTHVHESGHMLGLPDYYDYDGGVGPDGGVGDMDIMDGGSQDHNSFSKFVLDWLTPSIYATGTGNVTVYAMDATGSAAIVMPESAYASNEFYEYFVVENRKLQGNDTNHKGNGLMIWHVDARLDEFNYNYIYDNSYTDHKLLRVMEADGLEEIETGDGFGDVGDIYNTGDTLGPATTPNSNRYDGSGTFFTIDNISADSATMTFDFSYSQEYFSVVSVTMAATDTIDILYSATLDSSPTAVTLTNYFVDSGIATPSAAVVRPDNMTVRLTVPDLTQCGKYHISISNVKSNNNSDLYLASSPVFVDTYWTVIDREVKDPQTWTTAGDPYCIGAGDIYFYEPLTIEAGTVVKFTDSTSRMIFYYGELYVNGTAVAPVKFTSAAAVPATGDWSSVYLNGDPFVRSEVKYADFSFGTYGLYLASGADPVIENCSFRNNTQPSVYSCSTCSPVITSNMFFNDTWGVYLLGPGSITGNDFDDMSQNGVRIFATESVTIKDNNFRNSTFAVKSMVNDAALDATHNYFSGNFANTSISGCTNCSIDISYPLTNAADYTIEPAAASIALKSDATYTANHAGNINPTETLYIQLNAPGEVTAAVNDTVARVTSSVTDTTGIHVTLTETGAGTGIYRGTGQGAVFSNQSAEDIGVSWNETLTVSWVRDATVSIAVNTPTSGPAILSFTYLGQSIGPTSKTVSACAGDMDSDGDLDLAIANVDSVGEGTRVYINDGAGIFTDLGIGVGGEDTEDVVLADLDADGDLDVIQANAADDRPNRILRNDGAGSLSDSGQSLGTYRTFSVGAADFDFDGDIDFVAGNNSGDPEIIWINNGAGVFTDSGQELGTGTTFFVFPADVDNDGDFDFIVGNYSMEPGRVWLNDGRAGFTDSGQALGDEYTREIHAADLDGDGDVDYIEANGTSGGGRNDRVFMNDGSGVFTDSGQSIGAQQTFGIDAADLDGDGDLDYVAANYNQPNRVFTNDGSGNFSDTGMTLGSNYSHDVTLGDFDGDGDVDFFEANYQSGFGGDLNYFWVNTTSMSNSVPVAPALTAEGDIDIYFSSQTVVLEWAAGSDADTSDADFLTYDVRVGTTSAGCEIFCGFFPSAGVTPWLGYRAGNSGRSLDHYVSLATGTYYWSARTVDNTHYASAWSAEDSFTLTYVNVAPVIASGIFIPNIVPADGTTVTTVNATVGDANGLADIDTVTIDLSAIGGGAAVSLYDDGLHGDGAAGDDVYGATTTVSNLVAPGAFMLTVTATDAQAAVDTYDVSLDVTDGTPPTVTDNQAGDDTWYDANPGAIFDVDFSDTGGAMLSYAQYTAWTGAGMSGTETISWATIAAGINANSYTADWDVAFASLPYGFNYISVRAYDNAGNVSDVATDVFYVKVSESEAPTVTDNQTGDDTWRSTDPGAIFDVDFSDTGGSMLSYAQYSAWTASGMSSGTGTEIISWATIAENINANSYTADWGIDFSASADGYNFVSVRSVDNSGNYSAIATDVFYVKIDTSTPTAILTVNDGTGADISSTATDTQLSANWSASADNESGLSKYLYAIGTSAGAADTVDWTDIGTATGVTKTGLALVNGTTYYFTVKAQNGAGLYSNATNSDGQKVDIPDTDDPTITDNQTGDDTWRTSDPGAIFDVDFSDTGGSMLAYAQYAAWTASGMSSGTGTEIISWATIAENINTNSYTADWGIDFSAAAVGYNFVSVRVIDNSGNYSVIATDAFYVKIDTSTPTAILTVNDGTGADIATTATDTQLSANWSSSADNESGLAKYLYAIGTSAGATDTLDWTDIGTATGVTKTGLALVNGTTYYFTVKAQNGAGLYSNATNSDGQKVDIPDTDAPTITDNQTGDDTWRTSDPGAIFDVDFSDTGGSMLAYAQYAAWTASGMSSGTGTEIISWATIAENINTNSYTADWGIDFSAAAVGYNFVSVRVIDNAGNYSAIATDAFYVKIDTSTPTAIFTVNDGTGADIATTATDTQLSANWSASADNESGLSKYLYAIGTSAGATDTVDWTDIGTATGVTKTGLALVNGTTYYFTVKAQNGAGLFSDITNSDGQKVDIPDTDAPTITDNQTGDDTTYTTDPGAIFDVDFSDTGGSMLSYAQYTAWSGPGMTAGTGSEIISWTNIATSINSDLYTADWGVDFDAATGGYNFISVRAVDNAGNMSVVATDAFYVIREIEVVADSISPTVTDNQAGDDTEYTSDPGAIFDVDFSDTGGSMLSYAQYAVWSGAGMSGDEILTWTSIATGINSDSYTADWGVDFAALATGTNYISARAADNAGNMSAVAADVFYVKKGESAPEPADRLHFETGWNFIGISNINMNFDFPGLFGENRFEVWEYTDGEFQFVTSTSTVLVKSDEAYWVYTESDPVSYLYIPAPPPGYLERAIALGPAGWNAFANSPSQILLWDDTAAELVCGATQPLPDIYRYDNATGKYVKTAAGSGKLYPWIGYWIYTPADNCTLTVIRE